jgi:hypothetical protein
MIDGRFVHQRFIVDCPVDFVVSFRVEVREWTFKERSMILCEEKWNKIFEMRGYAG